MAALLLTSPALLVVGVATAGTASAHDELVSATPKAGATVVAPSRVVLRFSDEVLPDFSRMVLTRPGGSTVTTPVTVTGDSVTGALPAGLAPGAYAVTWRVSSADGHPVSGRLRFTVAAARPTPTAPPTATPTSTSTTTTTTTPTPTPTPTAPVAAPSDGSDGPGAALVAVPVVAFAGLLAFVVRRARRQPRGR